MVGLATRQAYSQKVGLPAPSTPGNAGEQEPDTTCIDVCAEYAGKRECQTRCVRDDADKPHACREACQTAFSAACDRAFPPSSDNGQANFQSCLSHLETSMNDTCRQFS